MNVFTCLMVLMGSATASGAALTGNELVLLRMILRQEMASEVQAAQDSGDAASLKYVAPLELALTDLPRVHDLYATMTSANESFTTQLNAARALAYFGDARSKEFLEPTLRGLPRNRARGPERNRAAIALLYLGYDFPDSFTFSTLSPAWYPELDAFLNRPGETLSSLSPYTKEYLETAIAGYLASEYPVTVRGPLSVLTVEQETLAAVLRQVAEGGPAVPVRAPFGNQVFEWEEFKDLILDGDGIYHFCTGDAAWQAQAGCEGYALIREGAVVAVIMTSTSRLQDKEVPVFDDFDGPLDFAWQILNPDPSHWSLSKVPGALTITTQGGTFFQNRQDYKNIFLIRSPTAVGQDFRMTTCLISFRPIGLWNQAGLLLWNGPDHYMKLVYEYGEGPPRPGLYSQCIYTASIETPGNYPFWWYSAEPYPERVWLRLDKRGPICELYTSTDGETFTPLTALAPEYGPADYRVYWGNDEVNYVGLFADNGGPGDAPSVDASFDFFEVRVLPPAEE
jgi:regulation of enolase protein 1 (concanavalin A-like superfamily)